MLMTIPSNLDSCCQHTRFPTRLVRPELHSHEANHGADLDDGENEFSLTKGFDTAQVDAHDDGQKDGGKNTFVDGVIPV